MSTNIETAEILSLCPGQTYFSIENNEFKISDRPCEVSQHGFPVTYIEQGTNWRHRRDLQILDKEEQALDDYFYYQEGAPKILGRVIRGTMADTNMWIDMLRGTFLQTTLLQDLMVTARPIKEPRILHLAKWLPFF